VPGGGVLPQGKWKYAKGKDKYLFPVSSTPRSGLVVPTTRTLNC